MARKNVNRLLGYDPSTTYCKESDVNGGEWVLNEIEDVVGSRMLYKSAGLDVARAYMMHVAKAMAKTTEKTPERGQENG